MEDYLLILILHITQIPNSRNSLGISNNYDYRWWLINNGKMLTVKNQELAYVMNVLLV